MIPQMNQPSFGQNAHARFLVGADGTVRDLNGQQGQYSSIEDGPAQISPSRSAARFVVFLVIAGCALWAAWQWNHTADSPTRSAENRFAAGAFPTSPANNRPATQIGSESSTESFLVLRLFRRENDEGVRLEDYQLTEQHWVWLLREWPSPKRTDSNAEAPKTDPSENHRADPSEQPPDDVARIETLSNKYLEVGRQFHEPFHVMQRYFPLSATEAAEQLVAAPTLSKAIECQLSVRGPRARNAWFQLVTLDISRNNRAVLLEPSLQAVFDVLVLPIVEIEWRMPANSSPMRKSLGKSGITVGWRPIQPKISTPMFSPSISGTGQNPHQQFFFHPIVIPVAPPPGVPRFFK